MKANSREFVVLMTAAVRKLVGRWNERRAIDRLSGFPDAMLKDIGVSRGEIPFAVRCSRDRDRPRRHPASSARSQQGGNVVPLRTVREFRTAGMKEAV